MRGRTVLIGGLTLAFGALCACIALGAMKYWMNSKVRWGSLLCCQAP